MDRVRIKKDVHSFVEQKPRQKTGTESTQANTQQTLANPGSATPDDVLALQQTAGNLAVTELLGSSSSRVETPMEPKDGLEGNFTSRVQTLRGTGMPLPSEIKEEMSHNLGTDFSSVRIHTNDQADQLSQDIQARAFTTGSDIFFRRGAFTPGTPEGKQTLKHELTHVIQQGGVSSSRLTLGPVNDLHEQEAERLSQNGATHPLADRPAKAAPAGAVQRFFFPWQKRKMEKLGGSMNTVFRVRHREGNVGYLKPNSPNDPTMGARSVLSSDIDKTLGTNALSNETYQNYGGGQEGTESGEVKGKEIYQNEFKTPETKAEYEAGIAESASSHKMTRSGPFGLRKKYFKFSGTKFNTHDFTNPATQGSLANIQLQDAITGQYDRHGGNIKINPETHEAKGYDNDLVDINKGNKFSRLKALHKPAGGAALSPEDETNRQKARAEAIGNVNSHGDKEVGLPSHINRDVAERMVGKKSTDFIADLHARNPDNMARLNPKSINELKERYSSVRRYTKAGMASAGLVADPVKAAKWSSPAYQETVRQGAGMIPSIVGAGGWNQGTYNEQVSKYTGRDNNKYSSYLQRSVLNYNDIQRRGGTKDLGDNVTHHTDNPAAPMYPAPAMQGPPGQAPVAVPHPDHVVGPRLHAPPNKALPPLPAPGALRHAPPQKDLPPLPPGALQPNHLQDIVPGQNNEEHQREIDEK